MAYNKTGGTIKPLKLNRNMFVKKISGSGFSVKAWQGDAKTLLAFNFDNKDRAKDLAGFSIQVAPHGKQAYYLFNNLTLNGDGHALVKEEPKNSTVNAPIQKFRWLHVPGAFHQGEDVFYGVYNYTITPRYFKEGKLQELDSSLSLSLEVLVQPFATMQLELGFTRGFTQSQAFVHHFGKNATFQPKGKDLVFDTKGTAGKNDAGQTYTYEQEYQWSGFTARQRIFAVLNEVLQNKNLTIDVFAYDLDEPDVVKIFIQLATEGRMRIILDNATLHHKPGADEDEFEKQFKNAAKKPSAIMRGKFKRFAHDKIFIIYDNGKPLKVLSGSTNFSVTGMYVNANHVIVFKNPDVAELYSKVFDEVWGLKVSGKFNNSSLSEQPFEFNQKGLPKTSITFSPHTEEIASATLDAMVKRINASVSSVLFAVMDLDKGSGPVFPALQAIHKNQQIFSYGISDAPGEGISLYKQGTKDGVLVTGKPGTTLLPPPFDKEHSISIGHQIHHKFIICDFGTENAVVWCGSSNLALLGEQENGENLIQISDPDIATVFAIEAIGLVDHFDFRNTHESNQVKTEKAPTAIKGNDTNIQKATAKKTSDKGSNELSLYSNDSWALRYFDENDLHFTDRNLFSN